MNSRTFTYQVLRADPEAVRKVLGEMFDHLHAISRGEGDASEDAAWTLLYQAERDLNESTTRQIGTTTSDATLDTLFSGLFRHLEAAGDLDALKSETALAMHGLRAILTERHTSGTLPYSYCVAGTGEESWEKSRAATRARNLQHEFRKSVRPASGIADLDGARGLILEAPLAPGDYLLAGAALARGLPAVLIAREALVEGVPTFRDASDAFRDLDRRAVAQYEALAPLEPEELMERPDEGDVERTIAALTVRCKIVADERDKLRARALSDMDRRTARDAEIEKLIRENGLEKPYFEIVANGSRAGHSPEYARVLNGARFRIKALEKEVAELKRPAAGSETPEP
ncbi:hypothetical protein [Defluviimonas salinarum]|uniref:Uncharacterized protein n=1 Tax=Defluviimonas salinarum TaxID=2992147 RepID=A0ABT3J9G8_9RHOB|nr:hypothetical protein [Defluviimonas salinarum]MCW3784305.1 hypothetical protein [Defluviimonas salinarum]